MGLLFSSFPFSATFGGVISFFGTTSTVFEGTGATDWVAVGAVPDCAIFFWRPTLDVSRLGPDCFGRRNMSQYESQHSGWALRNRGWPACGRDRGLGLVLTAAVRRTLTPARFVRLSELSQEKKKMAQFCA